MTTNPPAAMVEAVYIADGRGLFCALCGKTAIRHTIQHSKRLCAPPSPKTPEQDA